jgi:hypothetical protein
MLCKKAFHGEGKTSSLDYSMVSLNCPVIGTGSTAATPLHSCWAICLCAETLFLVVATVVATPHLEVQQNTISLDSLNTRPNKSKMHFYHTCMSGPAPCGPNPDNA